MGAPGGRQGDAQLSPCGALRGGLPSCASGGVRVQQTSALKGMLLQSSAMTFAKALHQRGGLLTEGPLVVRLFGAAGAVVRRPHPPPATPLLFPRALAGSCRHDDDAELAVMGKPVSFMRWLDRFHITIAYENYSAFKQQILV